MLKKYIPHHHHQQQQLGVLFDTSAILRALRARPDGLVPGGRPRDTVRPCGPTGVENCVIKLTCLAGRDPSAPLTLEPSLRSGRNSLGGRVCGGRTSTRVARPLRGLEERLRPLRGRFSERPLRSLRSLR